MYRSNCICKGSLAPVNRFIIKNYINDLIVLIFLCKFRGMSGVPDIEV